MFKFFENFSTVGEKEPALGRLSEMQRAKHRSRENAKKFAENIHDDIYVLSQFFDITPKIGKFGNTVKDENTAVLTLREDFMPGVKITFYINNDGVAGFDFSETEVINDD